MDKKRKDDIFYVCTLIEYIARETRNHRKDIIAYFRVAELENFSFFRKTSQTRPLVAWHVVSLKRNRIAPPQHRSTPPQPCADESFCGPSAYYRKRRASSGVMIFLLSSSSHWRDTTR